MAPISVLINSISYWLYLSFESGKFLVTTAASIVNFAILVINKLCFVLYVIATDFFIFLKDIRDLIHHIVDLFGYLNDLFDSYYNTTLESLSALHEIGSHTVLETILAPMRFAGHLILLTKQLLILVGSGCWFVVTLIPNALLDIVPLIANHTRNILQTLSMQILDGFEFITDFPIEAFFGLCILSISVYLMLEFRVVVKNYCRRIFDVFMYSHHLALSCCKQVASFIRILLISSIRTLIDCMRLSTITATEQRVRDFTRRPTRHFVTSTPTKEAENSLQCCVICMERVKCIVILPCKHLCMCAECLTELGYYNRTCPLCRKRIQSTLTVYM